LQRGDFMPARTHGQHNTKLYAIWCSMKQRCLNKKDKQYCDYGGRGITVCHQWLKFESFYEWSLINGYQVGLTIERISNDGNYEPENCKWIPKAEQSENTRKCKFITYKGETKILKHWARDLGMSYVALQHRLKRGWSIEEAFTRPVRK
jgi:hypothetical protein